MLSHNNRDYWKEISKIRSKWRSSFSVKNGYNDSTDIANEFASKYNVLYNSVTSDPTDMQSMALSIRKHIITTSESTDHSFPHVITMPDIKYDVKKLRAGKSGGISAVTSDCFIHGTDSLYAFIAMLFNAMLLHGTIPNYFLVSILIPIPKGSRVDVRKTQNYRAIALSSILGKILDNIIITSQRNVLKTSDLQFGYKSNCSTIMCSTLVIETIQYFTQMRSPVYVQFIDASKAFDRLSYIELFNILSERNMCPLIRRLLINLYENKQFQIRWNNCLSIMYNMTNGVKQGAVLSSILFTVYIDGLFYELKRAGVGCHINGEYAGVLGTLMILYYCPLLCMP